MKFEFCDSQVCIPFCPKPTIFDFVAFKIYFQQGAEVCQLRLDFESFTLSSKFKNIFLSLSVRSSSRIYNIGMKGESHQSCQHLKCQLKLLLWFYQSFGALLRLNSSASLCSDSLLVAPSDLVSPYANVSPTLCQCQCHPMPVLVPSYDNVSPSLCQCQSHPMPMLVPPYDNVSPTL